MTTADDSTKELGNDFNSHAHVERDKGTVNAINARLNFNSHAHVERDLTVIPSQKTYTISTHTLTWSVTSSAE